MALLLSVNRLGNDDMLQIMTSDAQSKPQRNLQEELRRLVGRRLSVARTDLNLSQDDVLRELDRYGEGRTQGSLSQIENGVRLPSLQVFYILAKLYDASANYLLGLSDDPRSLTDIEAVLAGGGDIDDERVAAANGLLSRLSNEKREQAIPYIEYLLSQEARRKPTISEFDEWVSTTEVLMARAGEAGENSFLAFLQRERPDLAAALGIPAKKKAV